MASIDWGVLGIGAAIGYGCRKQLRTAAKVAATTAASLAATAATAANQVAKETEKSSSPEAAAANAKVEEISRKIDQLWNELH